MPIAAAQTSKPTSADQVEYYYAKKDWKNLIKLGTNAIPKLKATIASTNNGSDRHFAIFAFKFAEDKDLPALQPLTEPLVSVMNLDGSANTRNCAAEALLKLRYAPEMKEQRLRYLLAFNDFRVDSDPRAYRNFERIYDLGQNREREAAMRQLVAMKDTNAELLIAILKDLLGKGHTAEAISAIITLGSWANKAATEELISIANCADRVGFNFVNVAPRCPITAVAVVALSKLDDPTSKDRIIDHILRLLDSKNLTPDVILASAIALERLQDKRCIPTLGKVLADKTIIHLEYEYEWPERLCKALVSFGPDSVEALTRGLENPRVSNYASTAIAAIRDEPVLLAQLASGKSSVPEALGKLKLKSSVPALLEALAQDKTSSEFKIATLGALSSIGYTSAINAVRLRMNDPDAQVRRHAAGTLNTLERRLE